MLLVAACQGDAGQNGPAGPVGSDATVDTETLETLVAELLGEFEEGLIQARTTDSERLDNTIHSTIGATQNTTFKERLTRQDSEIHRVFTAIEAGSGDPETARALELMQGIVVLPES